MLFDFWLNNFRNNIIINLIPFQAIISQLLFTGDGCEKPISFRCGAGNEYRAIDLEGNIFWCDEYVGEEKGIIGNIYNPNTNKNKLTHKQLFHDCTECNIEQVCLGRCRKCLQEYSEAHIRHYCTMTRNLVENIRKNMDEIAFLKNKYNVSVEQLYSPPYCTEEIP